MGPYIEGRQKGSSTPKQVLPYRTFIFNQVVGDLESSGIILQSRSYTEEYQITHQNRIWCRKEKGLWIRFYSRTEQWTRGKGWSPHVCVIFLRKISYVIIMKPLKYNTGPNLIILIHNSLYHQAITSILPKKICQFIIVGIPDFLHKQFRIVETPHGQLKFLLTIQWAIEITKSQRKSLPWSVLIPYY